MHDEEAGRALFKKNRKKWLKRQWFAVAFIGMHSDMHVDCRSFTKSISVSLIVTFMPMLGCLSSSTTGLYMYRIESRELIKSVSSVTSKSSSTLSHPSLPDSWIIGLSGKF